MDLQQHRAAPFWQNPRPIDIQLLAHAGGAIGNVADHLHVRSFESDGVAPVTEAYLAAQQVTGGGRDPVAVVVAQACPEGLLDGLFRLGGLPDAPEQAGPSSQASRTCSGNQIQESSVASSAVPKVTQGTARRGTALGQNTATIEIRLKRASAASNQSMSIRLL
ncbi:MAG: hypothetical protein P8Y92_12010 [Halioglobus sp.]